MSACQWHSKLPSWLRQLDRPSRQARPGPPRSRHCLKSALSPSRKHSMGRRLPRNLRGRTSSGKDGFVSGTRQRRQRCQPRESVELGNHRFPKSRRDGAALGSRSPPAAGALPLDPATFEKGEGRRVLDEVNVPRPSRADRGGSRDDETFRPRPFVRYCCYAFGPRFG